MRWVITAHGVLAIFLVAAIFFFLLRETLPVLKARSPWTMIGGRHWYPLPPSEEFGMLPLILGSLMVTAGAVAIALPLGLACAVYLAELAPFRIRTALKSAVEILAGIPSVVIGFIGLSLVAPWLKEELHLISGLTALTGSLMLAFMALPTVISISEDALVAVPAEYKQASLALGGTPLQTIWRSTIPAARSGLIAAAMLGVGRAIGETMTVMMVTGNAAILPHSLLQQVRTMTATIAAEMGETVHYSTHYHALFFIGLLLFSFTLVINTIADVALQRVRR
jgi:phosphate transport system permease protein